MARIQSAASRKKILGIIIACIAPMAIFVGLGLYFKYTPPSATIAPDPSGYWAFVSNDEGVWLINETLDQGATRKMQNLALLRSTIADISDSLVDEDTISDLTIHNEVVFGGDELNIPFGLYGGINEIARVLQTAILLYGGMTDALGEIIGGILGSATTNHSTPYFPVSIPSTYTLTQSEFYSFLDSYVKVYSHYNAPIVSEKPTWTYELMATEKVAPESFGIYFGNSTINQVKFAQLPTSRNWSNGIKFDVTSPAALDPNDNSTWPMLYHKIDTSNMMSNMGFYPSGDVDNYARFGLCFQYYGSSNAHFLIDLPYEGDAHSTWYDRLHGRGQTLSIQGNKIYIYEKESIWTWNPIMGWYDWENNTLAGNWTELGTITPNAWNNVSITCSGTLRGRQNTWYDRNASLDVTVNQVFQSRYNLTGNFSTSCSYRIPQMQFSAFNHSDSTPYQIYFDDLMGTPIITERNGITKVADSWLPASFIVSSGYHDAFENIPRWISYLTLNGIFFFPRGFLPKLLTYFEYFKDQIDQAFKMGGVSLDFMEFFPTFTKSGNFYSLNLKSNFTDVLLADLLSYDFIFSEIGPVEWELDVTIDDAVGLLSSVKMVMNYRPVNLVRTITVSLKKAVSPSITEPGYHYWPSGMNSFNYDGTSAILLNPEIINSRIAANSTYPTRLNPSDFSVNFDQAIMTAFPEIGPQAVFNQFLLQTWPTLLVAGVALVSVSGVLAGYLLALKKSRMPTSARPSPSEIKPAPAAVGATDGENV